MLDYQINIIAKSVKGKVIGNDSRLIKYLIIDSRNIVFPQETIYIAIVGKNHDGHKYIENLYKRGVKNFIVSYIPKEVSTNKDITFIIVNDTLKALQCFSEFHKSNFKTETIAITGSNGKTIVKEWLSFILSEFKKVTRSPRSYNSQVGVPLSLLQISNETEIAVIEAGISQVGEMENLGKIIKPNIGIITNIGHAHQENFESIAQKIKEKIKLFENCDTIIYCKDFKEIDIAINKKYKNKNLVSWSEKTNANFNVIKIETTSSTIIDIEYNNILYKFSIPFSDRASIENAITCFVALVSLNYNPDIIIDTIKKLQAVEMRLELKKGNNNCYLINDYYNSDIAGLKIAIEYLLQQNNNQKKTIIISDILESGTNHKELYSEISKLINNKKIFRVFAIGNSLYANQDLFPINTTFFKTTEDFISRIFTFDFKNETILLKAARKFQFESISNILQLQNHETVMEINLNALTHNYNYYKSLLKKETKIMAMVKAFSYGSGFYEIANILEHNRVDYLAVAYIDEGVELRKLGITTNIMVMNPDFKSIDLMIDFNLEPEVYSFRTLNQLCEKLKNTQLNKYPIHIKVDTGMHRLGFDSKDIDQLIEIIKNNNKLLIKSVFTHLVASDNHIYDNFTEEQIESYNIFSDNLSKSLNITFIKHVLNSNGIERFPQFQFDMVRLGIGMYGVGSSSDKKLQNVCSLKTTISQIKKVFSNETIGYNRNGKLKKDSVIATIPVGYADGIHRVLGNGRGRFLLKGKQVPTIGNICMDMTMLDITGIDAKEGDDVIIFGDIYPIDIISKSAETIPYEILTSISERVKRIYFKE